MPKTVAVCPSPGDTPGCRNNKPPTPLAYVTDRSQGPKTHRNPVPCGFNSSLWHPLTQIVFNVDGVDPDPWSWPLNGALSLSADKVAHDDGASYPLAISRKGSNKDPLNPSRAKW